MGGLHIFQGYKRFGLKVIIPLSAHNFLAISSTCSDATDSPCSNTNEKDKFNKTVKTITATDPSVATPVGGGQQREIIQAEINAYNSSN